MMVESPNTSRTSSPSQKAGSSKGDDASGSARGHLGSSHYSSLQRQREETPSAEDISPHLSGAVRELIAVKRAEAQFATEGIREIAARLDLEVSFLRHQAETEKEMVASLAAKRGLDKDDLTKDTVSIEKRTETTIADRTAYYRFY